MIALDHYMPGRDGLDVLRALRAMPEAPPVIFVTAAEEPRIAVTALREGAADYVLKDVQGVFLESLSSAIHRALDQERLREKAAAEQELRASLDRLETLAAQQAIMLREVDHRVGNSLQLIASLLHLQASSTGQEDVKAALTNAMGRVAAVAQVHRRLYTSHDLKSVLLEPVSRCPAGGSPAVRRGQSDVAADIEGRADRDRSRSRGGDRHHRQ